MQIVLLSHELEHLRTLNKLEPVSSLKPEASAGGTTIYQHCSRASSLAELTGGRDETAVDEQQVVFTDVPKCSDV